MALVDLKSECEQALAARGSKPKRRGDVVEFRCIRHSDKSASAWVGNAKWGCAACAFEEPITTLCEELGVAVPRGGGFTVEEYAELKGFSLDALTKWGVRTTTSQHGNDVVEIPYRDAEGRTLRAKQRTRDKNWWDPKGTGSYLYGLNLLALSPAPAPVIVVEGESDCHACWHHRVLAVGAPGANTWKQEWTPLLAGRQVYIWQEPGEAGAKFAQRLSTAFPDAKVMRSETYKDLADVFKASGKGFKSAVEELRTAALPIGATPPAIKFTAVSGGTLDALLERKRRPVDAVPTPLPTWNHACRDEGGGVGLARGWNVTIAGNTGHGKSLLALNLAGKAIRHGERVAYHSIEMSLMQLATRVLSIVSGISIRNLEQGGSFNERDWATAGLRMAEIRERTGGALFVNEAPIYKLDDIEAAIRYQTEYNGCKVHIVDYLQLCHVPHAKNVVDAVPIVSGKMRVLARDLTVLMVGLSQFNRETSKEKDQKPHVQGLMGGSALENDSDQVVLINHAKYVERGLLADTEILVAKNRHGTSPDIPVTWDYNTLTLSEQYEPGDAQEDAA